MYIVQMTNLSIKEEIAFSLLSAPGISSYILEHTSFIVPSMRGETKSGINGRHRNDRNTSRQPRTKGTKELTSDLLINRCIPYGYEIFGELGFG